MVQLPPEFEILTSRCRLRRPSEADIPHVFSATRIAGFNDGMAWAAPESIEQLREPLRNNIKAWTTGTAFAFTIESKADRAFLGRIAIRSHAEDGLWDIGFWMHPDHQGRGYMFEAAQAVVDFGFERLLAKRIQAGFVAWNVRSERILKKLGMKFVGHVAEAFQKKGQWVEVDVLAIAASDWKSRSYVRKDWFMTDNEIPAAQLAAAVAAQAGRQLVEGTTKIKHCLDQLTDEQVWRRASETQNSIGNLILHLCGNVRQWIVSGLGGAKDDRNRPQEFAERDSIPRAELLTRLDAVVRDAGTALATQTAADLLRGRRIQGFDVTALEAIFDSVPHFRGHTQEIIHMTRTLLGNSYRFWWTPTTKEQGV